MIVVIIASTSQKPLLSRTSPDDHAPLTVREILQLRMYYGAQGMVALYRKPGSARLSHVFIETCQAPPKYRTRHGVEDPHWILWGVVILQNYVYLPINWTQQPAVRMGVA